jgi:hypothetical protein
MQNAQLRCSLTLTDFKSGNRNKVSSEHESKSYNKVGRMKPLASPAGGTKPHSVVFKYV